MVRMPLMVHVVMAVMVMVVMVMPHGSVVQAGSQDKRFKEDASLTDPDTGQRFELHSEGEVTQLLDLDRVPEVKRVACVGDRLIVRMTLTAPALQWTAGQVVVGGPAWGCNATRHNGFRPQPIYVILVNVTFPLHDEVILRHVQAGPFDMLREAKIHFHYDPGKKTHAALSPAKMAAKKSRFRRSMSNLVSDILNHVDWQANLSASIPFNLGLDGENRHSGAGSAQPRTLTLHKSWGQQNLSLTRGQKAQEVKDDFVLFLDRLGGDSELTYTFDLVIENIKGEPKVVKYVNQYDLQASLEADAEVRFQQEMGVTFTNVTVDSAPGATELLRLPLVTFRGGDPPLPPLVLTVAYRAVSEASVSAYSAGQASLVTAFNATGFVTASQQSDPVTKLGSDVSSRDWSVDAQAQNLRSPHRTHVDFSIYQKLFFTSAVSWHYRDVDIELSPPMEITVAPEVRVRSSSPGVSRCVSSDVTVTAHVHAGHARFTADAFGLHLWDVPLQGSMTRDVVLTQAPLGAGCEARCHGPRHVLSQHINASHQITGFTRLDPQFSSLIAFAGSQVHFRDDDANATWCGQPGTSCHPCSQHASDTSADVTCASRLMTSRAAAALTLLADLALAEWPDKRVVVLEAWDELTSLNPSGRHQGNEDQLLDPLFRAGRALTLGLADSQGQLGADVITSNSSSYNESSEETERLAQLAVCAGFDLVTPVVNDTRTVQVGVAEDGWTSPDPDLQDRRTSFRETLDTLDVSDLLPTCSRAPQMSEGDTWPPQAADPALDCGPADTALHRGHPAHMGTLFYWNLTDAPSLTFEGEGQAGEWCGYPSRPCRDVCDMTSADLEPWNWCGTRMMTPRLALRLRRLQKLAEKKNIEVRVLQAFTETFLHGNASLSLYHEGRGVKLTTTSTGQLGDVASLAVCAGFDAVSFSASDVIEAFVKAQADFYAVHTSYFRGPPHAAVRPVGWEDDEEYSYPLSLREEDVTPDLLDGGLRPRTPLSAHVPLSHVTSSNARYFRLDPSLLECLELAQEDFSGRIEVIRDSVYRTRSENVRRNIDLRHSEELWRFQAGQAMEIRPAGILSSERLLDLATSVLRECPPLVRLQMRAVGLGCHGDRLYVDLRPLVADREREYVMVWGGEGEEGDTGYCRGVRELQQDMIKGGPVVQSVAAITCRDRQLDPGLQFLSFQMGQKGHCKVDGQAAFCRQSRDARAAASETLKRLLEDNAGQGRVTRDVLHGHITACLLHPCGGCPGVGPVFDDKVKACSCLVRYYVDHAASALPPDLTDRTAFYNLHTLQSSVHALACTPHTVCVEHTPLYSLFATVVAERYYPDPKKSLQRALFSSDVNPTPLLELVAQETAFRAKGKVTVYIEADTDIYALRNVLKVLMVYNKNVTEVEFHVTEDVDKAMVTSSVQRKLEAWSGVACPWLSRFALAPFRVLDLPKKRLRRSARDSQPRNTATARLYDWELDWLDKMF